MTVFVRGTVREQVYFVYILASRSRTLYIGVTNDLFLRVREHRSGKADSFTARHRIHRLVYYETFDDIRLAIRREKYLKHCLRSEKIAFIQAANATWEDLAAEHFVAYGRQKADPPPSAKDDTA